VATSGYAWAITSQVADQTRNDKAGNTQVGSLIYFTTGDGNDGVVFVPDNLLTTKHVTQVVRAQAKLIDDIGRLTEGTIGG